MASAALAGCSSAPKETAAPETTAAETEKKETDAKKEETTKAEETKKAEEAGGAANDMLAGETGDIVKLETEKARRLF